MTQTWHIRSSCHYATAYLRSQLIRLYPALCYQRVCHKQGTQARAKHRQEQNFSWLRFSTFSTTFCLTWIVFSTMWVRIQCNILISFLITYERSLFTFRNSVAIPSQFHDGWQYEIRTAVAILESSSSSSLQVLYVVCWARRQRNSIGSGSQH